MSQDRLQNTLLQLVALPSPSRRERRVADYILARLQKLGYHPEEDDAGREIGGEAGNILLHIPARGGVEGRLMLAAHIDTVETGERPVAPRVEGDWMRSDGHTILGGDDKTGVAALLELARRLKESRGRHCEVLLAFTVCEEKESAGAGALDARHYEDFDAGFVLDFYRPSQIVVAAPTKVTVRLDVRGRGAHAGHPEHSLNAAHILCTALARLPQGRLDEYSTANLGVVRAGDAVNIVPERAAAEYEIRSHHRALLDFHLKHVLGLVESTIRASRLPPEFIRDGEGKETVKPGASSWVDAEVEVGCEGYRLKDGDAPVRLASTAIEKVLGRAPELVTTQGASDANVFVARGLPSAVLGCGYRNAHTAEERVRLPELRQTLDIAWNLVAAGTE